MKKTLFKGLALAAFGSLLVAGIANATLADEWGLVEPADITTQHSVEGGFGIAIWTDDIERTSWHIRWQDDLFLGTTVFAGLIQLENNQGEFLKYSFESDDSFDADNLSANWFSRIVQGEDGIDFTITQLVAPSFVGFDLTYRRAGVGGGPMDPERIWLGSQNIADLGEDQDFAVAAPVPEPTTMLLFGVGLVGLAGIRRKINK